jgi:hypothetical protein
MDLWRASKVWPFINNLLEPYPPPFKYTNNAEYPFSYPTMYAPNLSLPRSSVINTESVKSNLDGLVSLDSPGGLRKSMTVNKRPASSASQNGGEIKPADPTTASMTQFYASLKVTNSGSPTRSKKIPPPPSGPPPLPANVLERGISAPAPAHAPSSQSNVKPMPSMPIPRADTAIKGAKRVDKLGVKKTR